MSYMYPGVLGHAVDDLEKRCDYFKKELDTAKAVITQMKYGRQGDTEYIHPYDLLRLVDNIQPWEMWTPLTVDKLPADSSMTIRGIKYIQTPLIPPSEDYDAYDKLKDRLKKAIESPLGLGSYISDRALAYNPDRIGGHIPVSYKFSYGVTPPISKSFGGLK